MRKTREILRLAFVHGVAKRQIARSLAISHSTVCDTIYRANAAGLDWPGVEAMDDSELDSRLYVSPSGRPRVRPKPDFELVHSELKRKGVTLQLLWYEYRQAHPDGYQYSQFCEHYHRWRGKLDVVMRQTYHAGEKMFVDYAGQTMRWIDRDTGEAHDVFLFVAVLGASNYTYAEVQPSQQLECWIGGHINAFEYFGGVTEIIVPDNTKTGVARACRYEPDLNPTYHEMATHYGTVVIPARPKKPDDKGRIGRVDRGEGTHGASQEPEVLQQRGGESGATAATREAQRQTFSETRGLQALRQGKRGLPRGGGAQLLQRALPVGAATGGCAAHPAGGRGAV